jgi:sulfur carrier protein ThiS
MKIILPDRSCKELPVTEAIIENILNDLGINPIEVIVIKNGRIVSELESIKEGDEMKVIRIVHGG